MGLYSSTFSVLHSKRVFNPELLPRRSAAIGICIFFWVAQLKITLPSLPHSFFVDGGCFFDGNLISSQKVGSKD